MIWIIIMALIIVFIMAIIAIMTAGSRFDDMMELVSKRLREEEEEGGEDEKPV